MTGHVNDFLTAYAVILAYALAGLAASVLAHWYVRTDPTSNTGSAYATEDRNSIARMHMRYRGRH